MGDFPFLVPELAVIYVGCDRSADIDGIKNSGLHPLQDQKHVRKSLSIARQIMVTAILANHGEIRTIIANIWHYSFLPLLS